MDMNYSYFFPESATWLSFFESPVEHKKIFWSHRKCLNGLTNNWTVLDTNEFGSRNGETGVLNEDRVARFSATTLPFPASENADVR
jgi:hypothetical protein